MTPFEHQKELLQTLEKTVNKALKQAAKNKSDFDGDAINWADLYCEDVRHYIDKDLNEGYVILIEEANPYSHKLIDFVRLYLLEHLPELKEETIEIYTEW